MENGLTKDEINNINNAVNAMAKVGLFCKNCRNVSCTCKDNLQVDKDDYDDDYDNIGLCTYCNHYHDLDNECTEEFEY